MRIQDFTPEELKKQYPEDYTKFVGIWKKLGENIEEADILQVTFSDDERIVVVRANTQI